MQIKQHATEQSTDQRGKNVKYLERNAMEVQQNLRNAEKAVPRGTFIARTALRNKKDLR